MNNDEILEALDDEAESPVNRHLKETLSFLEERTMSDDDAAASAAVIAAQIRQETLTPSPRDIQEVIDQMVPQMLSIDGTVDDVAAIEAFVMATFGFSEVALDEDYFDGEDEEDWLLPEDEEYDPRFPENLTA